MIEEAVRAEIRVPIPLQEDRASAAHRILVLGLLVIVAVGVAMRLYGLGKLPYGLFHDEAWEGLDALRVLAGAHPLYFPENSGREPIFIYLMALTLRIFGRNPLGIRAAAAVCGLLTLPATYLLGRAWGSPRVGLLGMAILAVTLWHVQLSRVGLRAVALPLFIALGLGCSALAFRSRSLRLATAAGVALGLCLYTYTAARFTPLALLGMALYGLIWHREWLRSRWAIAAAIAGGAFLTVLPLAVYLSQHPDAAFNRSGDVAIWNNMGLHRGSLAGALARSMLRTLGMFTWRGDAIWRHNVPHRPVFDPLLSAAFLGGVVVALVRWRSRPAWALCIIWIGVMALPTMLSEDAPHFLRAAGVLPVAVLLPALALDAVLRWITERRQRDRSGWDGVDVVPTGRAAGTLASAALVGVLGLSSVCTAGDYFASRTTPAVPLSGFDFHGAYLREPRCGYAFQAQLTELARVAAAAQTPVYLDGHYWDVFTAVRFLLPLSERIHLFDIDRVPPPARPPFTLLAWPYEGVTRVVGMLPAHAEIAVTPGPWTRGDLEQPLWREFVRWTVTPLEGPAPESWRAIGLFDGGLALLDAHGSWDGGTFSLELRWMRDAPTIKTGLIRIQAIGAGGRVLRTVDELLGTAFYPPMAWTPGSVISQRITLEVPPADRASLRLQLGLADVASHRPLRVRAASVPVQGDALLLEAGIRKSP
jgi:4-amino-4-deoxy-L-arabinose transferase-like glycosyltransferase